MMLKCLYYSTEIWNTFPRHKKSNFVVRFVSAKLREHPGRNCHRIPRMNVPVFSLNLVFLICIRTLQRQWDIWNWIWTSPGTQLQAYNNCSCSLSSDTFCGFRWVIEFKYRCIPLPVMLQTSRNYKYKLTFYPGICTQWIIWSPHANPLIDITN
jgi:hypothetical protein